MYLYGGSSGLNTNSTFYALDLNTNLWELVRSKQDEVNTPPECDEHTAVVHDEQMILFGGFVDGDRVNCVHKFNFKLGEWRRIQFDQAEKQPSARAGHSAVVCPNVGASGDSYMYVFGGRDNEDVKLNDLWRLNLSTEKWEQVLSNEASTDVPCGRCGHSSEVYNGYLLVFGGIFEITKELNDLFIFNLETRVWKRLFRASIEENLESPSTTLKQKKTRKDDSPDVTAGTSKLNSTLMKQKTIKMEAAKKPKPIKSPKAAEEPVNLESPTSVTMKQSFLLKQSDKEFEGYWNFVRKKKDGHPACAQAFGLLPPTSTIGGAR